MTKGLPRSLSRGNPIVQAVTKQNIVLDDFPVTVGAVTTAVGFGTAQIGDFAEGNILILGIVASLNFAGSGADANLTADWEGDFSLGTTGTADVTLDGTDVDLIASTAIPAATAEVSPVVRATNATQAILDNTGGAMEINLNLLIDAADIVDDEEVIISVSGMVTIAYIVLGDD